VLLDPLAVELVGRIDYPFEQRFGAGAGLGQWQALRARCFDREVRRFAAAHPAGTVVALGEGFETQFWRVDDGHVRWLTVDLPEVIAARERLLPSSPRLRTLACSAIDTRWMEEVDASRGVLVTAQGLLMYLPAGDVHRLLPAIAGRFARGGAVVFDAVPRWLSERSRRGQLRTATGYQAPPWLWGMDGGEARRLGAAGLELQRLRPPRGRGPVHGLLLPAAYAIPGARDLVLTIFRAGL
jgi:O-methyltransferase involved in polyketide biosynthesis